jgi:hypothetical protein
VPDEEEPGEEESGEEESGEEEHNPADVLNRPSTVNACTVGDVDVNTGNPVATLPSVRVQYITSDNKCNHISADFASIQPYSSGLTAHCS